MGHGLQSGFLLYFANFLSFFPNKVIKMVKRG